MITAMPRIAIAAGDFEAMIETFGNRFGMPLVDLSDSSVVSLGARLAMCVPEGGSNIELMSPADPEAPLAQSLHRFLDRRGEGLFALMLEAPDPDAEAAGLERRGLNVLPLMAGAAGRDVHPRSTCGVLVRIYPVNSFVPEPARIRQSPSPSDLSGIVRVIVVVHDLLRARNVWGEGFGLPAGEPVEDAERGITSIVVTPPAGGVIELVSVTDAGRPFARSVGAQLERRGEGLHALVLNSREGPSRETEAFGARILIEAA